MYYKFAVLSLFLV